MLSYQHAYHAGCLADVHKHMALAEIVQAMVKAHPRISYMETHSGRGLYRLDSKEAQKTGEAAAGIGQLANRLPKEAPFMRVLGKVRSRNGAQSYPGSPLIAKLGLRAEDRLTLFELHPAEHAALSKNLHGRNVRIFKQDGYQGVLKIAPPNPRNGLVVIDPSYEVKGEYEQAAGFIRALLKKWPQASVLLWYPMLKSAHYQSLLAAMDGKGMPSYWHQQVVFCDPEAVRGMHGTGLFGINLPPAVMPALEKLPQHFSRITTAALR